MSMHTSAKVCSLRWGATNSLLHIFAVVFDHDDWCLSNRLITFLVLRIICNDNLIICCFYLNAMFFFLLRLIINFDLKSKALRWRLLKELFFFSVFFIFSLYRLGQFLVFFYRG